jgi:hypothetical protein
LQRKESISKHAEAAWQLNKEEKKYVSKQIAQLTSAPTLDTSLPPSSLYLSPLRLFYILHHGRALTYLVLLTTSFPLLK